MTLFAKCTCGRATACDGMGGLRCNSYKIQPVANEFSFEYEDINFKVLRKLHQVTLKELEKATGINNAYLSQIETGKIKKPSFDTVVKILKFYGFELRLITKANP